MSEYKTWNNERARVKPRFKVPEWVWTWAIIGGLGYIVGFVAGMVWGWS